MKAERLTELDVECLAEARDSLTDAMDCFDRIGARGLAVQAKELADKCRVLLLSRVWS